MHVVVHFLPKTVFMCFYTFNCKVKRTCRGERDLVLNCSAVLITPKNWVGIEKII